MPKKKGITNLNGRNKTDSTSTSDQTKKDVKPVNAKEIILTSITREFLSQMAMLIKDNFF